MKTPLKKAPAVLLLTLCLSLTLFGTGCEIKMPWDKTPPKPAEETTDAPVDEGGGGDSEPLDMNKLLPPAMRNLPYEEVTIPMQDKLKLYGRLYDPSLTKDENGDTVVPAAEATDYQGPHYPLVVLVHGLDHDNGDWQDLPATLVKAGYAVFAMDLRGHGKSNRTAGGRWISWRMLQTADWAAVPKDLDTVLKYFHKGEDYPEVGTEQVALIGEQLGANVATQAAKTEKASVKALVLLTPMLEIKGIDASRGLMDYPNSTLILVSDDDKDSYTTANHLYNWVLGPKTLQVYHQAGLGTDMLVSKPGIGQQIRDWLLQALPTGIAPTKEATEPNPASVANPGTDADKAKKPEKPTGAAASAPKAEPAVQTPPVP